MLRYSLLTPIEMAKEKHCTIGLVPLRLTTTVEVLLIRKRKNGRYGLPKGHPIPGENDLQTLTRELREETGCEPVLFLTSQGFSDWVETRPLPDFTRSIVKSNGKNKVKTTRYYVGTVRENGPVLDTAEVEATTWVSFPQAATLLQDPELTYFHSHLAPLQDLVCRILR